MKTNSVRIFPLVLFLIIISMVVFFGCTARQTDKDVTLTISAASSLKKVMSELAVTYNQEKPNVILTFNYGSSGDLQQQIENGAPTDVFISAAKKQMKILEDKELLLHGTNKDLLQNKLVVIVPKGETLITSIDDLALTSVKQVAIGEPSSVPAGQYANEAFEKMGILDKITAKSVYGKDALQVLTYVEQGEVDAGVVYMTDAKSSDKVSIVESDKEFGSTPIIYPVAVINSSKMQLEAIEFLAFLSSDNAKKIFEKYGFTTFFN